MSTPKGAKPWNAGTSQGWIDKRGYRWIYVEENGKRRAKREHRHIIELHLGRRLEPEELVHHLNHLRSDNRIENLRIDSWERHTVEHHIGTKRADTTKRSLEVLATYREEHKRLKEINSELLWALKKVSAFLDDLSKSNPGYLGKLLLQDYGQFNEALIAMPKAIARAEGRQP